MKFQVKRNQNGPDRKNREKGARVCTLLSKCRPRNAIRGSLFRLQQVRFASTPRERPAPAGGRKLHPTAPRQPPRDHDHRRVACTGRCPLLSALRTQVRYRGMSEKCQQATLDGYATEQAVHQRSGIQRCFSVVPCSPCIHKIARNISSHASFASCGQNANRRKSIMRNSLLISATAIALVANSGLAYAVIIRDEPRARRGRSATK